MARPPTRVQHGQFWDLVNIPSRFRCCKRAREAAAKKARDLHTDIIVRHHGHRPSPNNDPTRVNHWVMQDGRIVHTQGPGGEYVDVAG